MIYHTEQFKIYFGTAQDAISKSLDCIASSSPLIVHKKFAPISKKIAVDHLAFLNQTHGTDGIIITQRVPAFDIDGDYLITRRPNVGIGVMTADCLPIIIYDQKNHTAAIVHAGWRGTVARIAQETINKLRQEIGSQAQDLQIFFGPSAKVCCYKVSNDFKKRWFDTRPSASLTMCSNTHPECEQRERIEGSCIFLIRNDHTYFDVPHLNSLLLQEKGVSPAQISHEYNFCTICDHRFYSYRRQGEIAGRQMSIISIT